MPTPTSRVSAPTRAPPTPPPAASAPSPAASPTARELSLDTDVDSPFAVLAKDNDICWGGGRPDDTTVIVARVVDPEEDAAAAVRRVHRPREPPDQMLKMIAQLEKEKKESVAATVENFEEW